MSDNWAFAVDSANGEYITLIGDDDGLLPYALNLVDRVIGRFGAQVVRWNWALYFWPGVAERLENMLMFGLPSSSSWQESDFIIREVAELRTGYSGLPMLYNSVVKRDILDDIKHKAGHLFQAVNPDIYSGFCVAMSCGKYFCIRRCLGIAGMSPHSNGHSHLHAKQGNSVANDFRKLNAAAKFTYHASLPNLIRSSTVGVIDSFLRAKDVMRRNGKNNLGVRPASFLEKVLIDLHKLPDMTQDDWIASFAELEAKLGPSIPNFSKVLAQLNREAALEARREAALKPGFKGGFFWIDSSKLQVKDVLGAVGLLGGLFPWDGDDLPMSEASFGYRERLKDFVPPVLLRFLRKLREHPIFRSRH